MTTRKDQAKEILRSIMADLGKHDVTTVGLLYKCQEVSRLLELGDDSEWINSELIGYPSIDLASSSSKKGGIPPDIRLPRYRTVNLAAIGTAPTASATPSRIDYERSSRTTPFFVAFPCGLLETAQNPMILSFDVVFEVPPETWTLSLLAPKRIRATFSAELSVDIMQGIVYAIRGRVAAFASGHYTALSFENPIWSIVDATRNLLADRLQKLHPPTLDMINETLDKQQKSTDPLEWRDVLENTRTIVRRITGVLIQKSMLPDGASIPEEGETKKKTKLILDWARTRLGKEYDKEIDYVDGFVNALAIQQGALIGMINKPIHKEVTDITRGDVDRIVLTTTLWIADMIAVLDKAGYDWSGVQT